MLHGQIGGRIRGDRSGAEELLVLLGSGGVREGVEIGSVGGSVGQSLVTVDQRRTGE